MSGVTASGALMASCIVKMDLLLNVLMAVGFGGLMADCIAKMDQLLNTLLVVVSGFGISTAQEMSESEHTQAVLLAKWGLTA